MAMGTYSFKKVIVLVGGIPITGFAEGDDVIQVGRRVDTFDLNVGADGSAVSAQNADRSGEIILRLQQTALSHTFMSAQFALMESGLLTSVPFLLKDAGNLVQLAAAAECVIQRPADSPYGTALNDREWTLLAGTLILS